MTPNTTTFDQAKSAAAVSAVLAEVKERTGNKSIFITHSHVPAEIVEKVKQQVKALHPFAEVIETIAGCTISSHCGPCCLGVLFFKKKD